MSGKWPSKYLQKFFYKSSENMAKTVRIDFFRTLEIKQKLTVVGEHQLDTGKNSMFCGLLICNIPSSPP